MSIQVSEEVGGVSEGVLDEDMIGTKARFVCDGAGLFIDQMTAAAGIEIDGTCGEGESGVFISGKLEG